MSTKQLNRRQAKCSEYLSHFNFVITYRPGKQGGKPDALNRRSGDLPDEEDERLRHQSQTVLKTENIEAKLCLFAGSLPNEPARLDATLTKLIQEGYNADLFPQKILKVREDKIQQSTEITLGECSNTNGLLHFRELLYILAFDPLKLHILQQYYDAPSPGHPGREKTFELISRDFYWP